MIQIQIEDKNGKIKNLKGNKWNLIRFKLESGDELYIDIRDCLKFETLQVRTIGKHGLSSRPIVLPIVGNMLHISTMREVARQEGKVYWKKELGI